MGVLSALGRKAKGFTPYCPDANESVSISQLGYVCAIKLDFLSQSSVASLGLNLAKNSCTVSWTEASRRLQVQGLASPGILDNWTRTALKSHCIRAHRLYPKGFPQGRVEGISSRDPHMSTSLAPFLWRAAITADAQEHFGCSLT